MAILAVFHDVYNYLFSKNENNKKPNLGEDLRQIVHSPEFKQQWRFSSPFLVAGLVGWPAYWLYRSYEWHKTRGIEPLHVYIKKTFHQAKMLEFGILMTAILMLLKESSSQNMFKRHEIPKLIDKK